MKENGNVEIMDIEVRNPEDAFNNGTATEELIARNEAAVQAEQELSPEAQAEMEEFLEKNNEKGGQE